MKRRLLFPFWIALSCGVAIAQANRTITIKVLDSKTGKPISTSEIEIGMRTAENRQKGTGITPLYAKPNAAGVTTADLPAIASEVRVSVNDRPWQYVNCDATKDHTAWKDHWYSITEILSTGVAAPNYCSKRNGAAKPGEFIIFVRPMTFWEKMRE